MHLLIALILSGGQDGGKKNWDKDKRKHPGGERRHAVVQALTQDTATSVIHPLVDTSTETLCVKLQAA